MSTSVVLLSVLLLLGVTATYAHNSANQAPKLVKGVQLESGVVVTVNTTLIQHTGSWVSVSWSGVTNPVSNDTIAVYPLSNNYSSISYFKEKECVKWSSDYMSSGSGVTTFRLINVRMPYVFAVVQMGVVIGISEPVYFANPNEPVGGHLAMTSNPSEMRVMWTSFNSSNPTVQYRAVGDATYSTIVASSITYTAEQMCGSPAADFGWINPGLIHDAVITGLVPGVKYTYIYGDAAWGWSEENVFFGPKLPNAVINNQFETVAFLAIGDMGKAEVDGSTQHWMEAPSLNTTKNMYAAMQTQPIDAMLHIGDIAYAVGYAEQWDEFFDQIEPIATAVPYMVCPGNHEWDYLGVYFFNGTDSGGECGVPYGYRFNMPLQDQTARTNFIKQSQQKANSKDKGTLNISHNWYSFTMSGVHVVMFNTEETFEVGSPQHTWLQQDLASVDRTKVPFLLVAGHRPMYLNANVSEGAFADQYVASLLRTHLEPLFAKYQVDLAIWGHHHSYQRSCPLYNSTCVENGTVHAIIGMAGMGLSQNIDLVKPDWQVFVDDEHFGYSIITVTSKTMTLEYFQNTGGLADTITIPRKF